MIKKVKNTVPWTYVNSDLNDEKKNWNILWKRIAKNKSKEFRIEKIIKEKGNKLYVKWKGYDNSLIVGLTKRMLRKHDPVLS